MLQITRFLLLIFGRITALSEAGRFFHAFVEVTSSSIGTTISHDQLHILIGFCLNIPFIKGGCDTLMIFFLESFGYQHFSHIDFLFQDYQACFQSFHHWSKFASHNRHVMAIAHLSFLFVEKFYQVCAP